MKAVKVLALVLLLAAVAVVPALADFGTTVSSVTVQNTGADVATVTFTFYDEGGTAYTPDPLTTDGSVSNPFILAVGESYELYMPNADLADGKYSLVIASDQPVVAVSNVVRDFGELGYNGTFAGFSMGDTEIYMPSITNNCFGYYSELSVQNTGDAATDITVDFGGGLSDTATGVAPGASAHWDLSMDAPPGLGGCVSAIVTADQPIAAVDNQFNQAGFLQTYNSFLTGAMDWGVTALYNGYFGWSSSLDIQNVGTVSTTVTVEFADGDTPYECTIEPGEKCQPYMPNEKSLATELFAASVSASEPLVVVVNSANGGASLAQSSNAVSAGGMMASIPAAYNGYYGWNSSWACVNLGGVATDLMVDYDGFGSYTVTDLQPGDSLEVYVPLDTDGPTAGNRAAVMVESTAAPIACTYNATQDQLIGTGDWAFSGNAFAE
jgi:hypothetical protein